MIADTTILGFPKVSLKAKQLLPEYSGIYYILDEANTVWYIGKAKNIRKRWQGKTHHRIYQLEAQKKKHFTIYYEAVSESQLDIIEKQRIETYHPHLNSSPVKTKKVRPTETLLRETLAAISDFAFILGMEPPRKEVEDQIGNYCLIEKKVLGLNVIHICLDDVLLDAIYKPESTNEIEAINKKIFKNRKVYANKWESFPPAYSWMYRLLINGYAVEVTYWNHWCPAEKSEEVREYIQTNLAQESIRALTAESLKKLQEKTDKNKNSAFCLQRLNPYTSDLIKLLFNELVNSQECKQTVEKIIQDYKTGKRGIGSRSTTINSEFISVEELLMSRGIDVQKYSRGNVINLSRGDRMGLYIQCFTVDFKQPSRYSADSNNQQIPLYNSAYGILNNQKKSSASCQFNTVYLLAGVEKKAWLLFEEYLKDFAKPATQLNNGEGVIEKFYISTRKYIVPAKVNIKLETIGYSAWIPFGISEKFPTFEATIEEIRNRLNHSDLPGLKLIFKRETFEK